MSRTWIFLAVYLLLVPLAQGQGYQLMGKLDHHLVTIDTLTGDVTVYKDLVNYPPGENLRDLTLHKQNGHYYSIKETTSSPHLVKISPEGVYKVIGPFTLNGNQILLAESLAYNSTDNKLYAGVSLNGGVSSGDFHTESIVEVDTTTGNCTFVSEIVTNRANPDLDVIAFDGNVLYIADGNPPSPNFLSIYRLDFDNLGPLSNPVELYRGTYLPIYDFSIIGKSLYLTEGRNLWRFLIQSNGLQPIGPTHNSTEFNGELIYGISKKMCELTSSIDLGEDLELCPEETALLDATLASATSYLWQDGSTDATYTVTQPGLYWVDVTVACGIVSDTVLVEQAGTNTNIPNVFTPNNDGINDFFEIQSEQNNLQVQIYNRWGRNVYESSAYQNDWDGADLASGIYFYLVTSPCLQYKGWVQVMRE